MKALRHALATLRYWRAMLKWLGEPFPTGDPSLGRTREQRNENIKLIDDRWNARKPVKPVWPKE